MRVITRGKIEGVVRRGVEVVRVADRHALRSVARPGDYVLLPAADLGARVRVSPVEMMGLRVDDRTAEWQGRPFPLTLRERRILYELIAARGRPVDRDDLRRTGWSDDSRSRNIDRVVSRLRAKLRSIGFDVLSERKVGYRIERALDRQKGVLVIEDDPDMRRAFLRVLHSLEVDVASSIAEALSILRARRYAALIVDLGLPDGCGSTLIPIVHRWNPPPAVMIVTARTDPDAIGMSGRFGVPYCPKPADPTVIRSFAMRAIGLAS
jgi:DNA-binding response OmpR family regulator